MKMVRRKSLYPMSVAATCWALTFGLGCDDSNENEDTPFTHTYEDVLDPVPGVNLDERVYPEVPPVADPVTTFSGQVKDIFTYASVAGVEVYTKGLAPSVTATSEANGSFSLEVPVGSIFVGRTYKSEEYAYLHEPVDISQPVATYAKDLYALSKSAFEQFYTEFDKVQNQECGAVLLKLETENGQNQAGVSGITLYGADSNGPYFLNDEAAPSAALDATSDSGWAVFLNVCSEGEETAEEGMAVQLAITGNYYNVQPIYVNIYKNGMTRATAQVREGDAPIEPDPEPQPVIDFPTEIMPVFAKYACNGCHTEGGPGGGSGLYFDVPSENVFAKLLELEGVVNLQYPSQSTLLTYPLLEEPANHPNASFENVYNEDYVKILQWIESGAVYGVEPAPPPVENVDFLADVYPLFQTYDAVNYPYGRNCTACHSGADPSGDLDLSDGADNVYLRMVEKQLYDVNYPDRSKILRNPYCGETKCLEDEYPETHPTEVFANTDDPDYQKILLWVTQGAQYEVVVEPEPDLPQNVDFASQVQYRFATRGCIGCHSKESPSGGLSLVGTPQQVYDAAYAQTNQPDYEDSYIYTKPNAAFPDVTHSGPKQIPNAEDNYARYVAGWIYEGAQFTAPAPVAFSTDVYPQFQVFGCVGCHNDASAPSYGNLSLQGDAATVFAALEQDYTGTPAPGVCAENDCNRIVPGYPAQSYILTKMFDLYADVNHGGGKTQAAANYNVYQTMANWIAEGATYEVSSSPSDGGTPSDGGPSPDGGS